MKKNRLLKWVEKFTNIPILVVGDLMLDRSIWGSVERISPEAPVPVVTVNRDERTAGGAGNVVYNLAQLGALPTLISVCGNDPAGEEIIRDFRIRSLNTQNILVDDDRPTIRKIRVIAGQQQIVRVDFEKKDRLSSSLLRQLRATIKDQASLNRAVIISDYGKGVISVPVIKQVLKEAKRRKMVVTVDPKVEHFQNYRSVDCITPNVKEAIEGMRVHPPKNEEGFLDLGKRIIKKLKTQSLLMTRGEKGILLFRKNAPSVSIPAQAREVFDVTGAGDTVVSVFTLARAVGAPYEEAAQIANFAAGIVVGKLGTACVTRKELHQTIRQYRGE
ncbi:hypothetical protein BVX98_02760 [bacterium F11]|nr:hypothetical protein BVX98_02760 [bacterium F11]